MLGQSVEIHVLADCCLDDFVQCVLCMATELARVGMERERHLSLVGKMKRYDFWNIQSIA